MAKKATVSGVGFVLNNLVDAGYQSAKLSDSLRSVALYVAEQCPDFPEMKPEQKEQLFAGYAKQWQENNPAKAYSPEWMPCEPSDMGASIVTLDYCLSFSSAEFGKLRDSNAVQHGIVGEVRNKFSTYKSNKFDALKSMVAKIKKEQAGETARKANKYFEEYLKDTMDGIITRNKTATARGDATVIGAEKLRQAIAQFLAAVK